jgi:branched-chain amino acid transport system permease protein
MGTLWGPVLGALVLHALAEGTRNLFGNLPGLNLVIYGSVLVVIVMFMPRGLAGAGDSLHAWWQRRQRD